MNLLLKRGLFGLATVLLCTASCKKKNIITQAKADDNIIQKYLSDNSLTATATGSGLYYIITTQGTGVQPNSKSDIIVSYKGYLTNGSVFDQSKTGGYTTNLAATILGWQEGLLYFKKGGTGKLLVPSALGYGATVQTNIPANSVLIFDITLMSVL